MPKLKRSSKSNPKKITTTKNCAKKDSVIEIDLSHFKTENENAFSLNTIVHPYKCANNNNSFVAITYKEDYKHVPSIPQTDQTTKRVQRGVRRTAILNAVCKEWQMRQALDAGSKPRFRTISKDEIIARQGFYIRGCDKAPLRYNYQAMRAHRQAHPELINITPIEKTTVEPIEETPCNEVLQQDMDFMSFLAFGQLDAMQQAEYETVLSELHGLASSTSNEEEEKSKRFEAHARSCYVHLKQLPIAELNYHLSRQCVPQEDTVEDPLDSYAASRQLAQFTLGLFCM